MEKVKKGNWAFALLILVFLVGTSAAVPVGRETHQMWTFDDDDNPALPEVDNNPFGDPTARFTVTSPEDPLEPIVGPSWYLELSGRGGVWFGHPKLNASLWIPNRPEPDQYKEIWLEMGFQGYVDNFSVAPVPSGGIVRQTEYAVIDEEDNWKTLILAWYIEPNPYEELLCIGIQNTGAKIDYIIVETICVPEPAAICMLAVGSLGMLRRRSRR
jgi:hypothetical protein